jgi:hypothetical protein
MQKSFDFGSKESHPAKHHGKRIPAEIREFIIANRKELSVPEISEKVSNKFGAPPTLEAVRRWSRRGLD